MKITNTILLSAFISLSISSCKAPAEMIVINEANIDKTPLKTTKILDKDLQRWSHLDLVRDTVPGMSIDKANEFLKGRKSTKVIVAIIDSGIDIEHEDLKGSIWTNTKEIAGNKKDDDNNGYIDDIHGWNFLGESDNEQLELTRIVKKGNTSSQEYQIAKSQLDKKLADLEPQKKQLDMILGADKACATYLKKKTYTLDEVKSIKTTEPGLSQAKMIMTQILTSSTKEAFDKEMIEFKDYVYDQLNYNLNVNFDGRKILGDDPENLNTKFYGNNIVWGPKKEGAKHGTHVAGIIAQIKNNGKGGDGVATKNVEIMTIRAVPNGDEYDKDIANAIYYAVNNGAKVINGSFGKDYSPHKQWVFDAIKYAESKDVLFVHAAGNDSKNIDTEPNFPNDADGANPEFADNVLTIGALNFEYGSKMIADFSNFGKTNVDIFAPGVKIYATTPNNNYEYLQGTSMASPNVAGVAALIRSLYPSLKASQVKHIIMDSGSPIATSVSIGEEVKTQTSLLEISRTGKIVNAYNALVLANNLALKKNK
jgi:subtilisin family serine protease